MTRADTASSAEVDLGAFRSLRDALGDAPLTEALVAREIRPLFSRVLAREEIYLANHSLGRPPDRTREDVLEAVDAWYADVDGAWGLWAEEIGRYRRSWAALIGCSRADAVAPKTSAGQGLRAVLNALPVPRARVVATRGEFDSIDYILKTYQKRDRAVVRWVDADGDGLFHADDIIRAIEPGTDLVVCSQVLFASGQLLTGIDRIVEAAHTRGAKVLVDTYHGAGAMPVGFDELGADFAIGGSYKYVRGGPGAAWLAVHPRHLLDDGREAGPDGLMTLDTGWFAKADALAFERSATPAPGGDAWLEATPPVLTYFQARAGLAFTLAVGVERLRAYSLEMQRRAHEALQARGVPVRAITPRGAFLLVPAQDPSDLAARLRERGVNVDARRCPTTGAGFVRVCPDVLTTREEIARAAEAFGACLRR